MKILMVSGTFPPRRFGGVTAVSYILAKRLVKKGHEVSVYTTDVGNDRYSRLNVQETKIIDGIYVHYFRNISNSLAFTHRLFLPVGLFSAIKRNITNIDIIHTHEFRGVQEVLIRHYAKKYNIPYIIQAHGSLPLSSQKQRLKNIFDLFFGYKILRDASKVIALTKTEAEQYEKMGVPEDKIEIVPNGIDLSEYENLPGKGEFRKKYSIKDDEKMILYMGRLHKSKGIDILVSAFADLLKELNNVRLVLVGPDDGYRLALEEFIQASKVDDKVLFTGFVTNDEKMAAFVDADVFVTPRFSGFPLTFLEACACGTPIITTNNGDELEWIHDKVGFVVEYDKDQLRDAIIKVLNDDGLRRKFGEEGRRLVKNEFEWNMIVEQILNVYKRVICDRND